MPDDAISDDAISDGAVSDAVAQSAVRGGPCPSDRGASVVQRDVAHSGVLPQSSVAQRDVAHSGGAQLDGAIRGVPTPGGTPRRVGILTHPLMVLAVVALAGSCAVRELGPAALAAAGFVLFAEASHPRGTLRSLWRSLSWWGLLVGVFLLCQTRASTQAERYRAAYHHLRSEWGGPQRCHGYARVLVSPTLATTEDHAPARTPNARGANAVSSNAKQPGGERVTLFTALAEELDCERGVHPRGLILRLTGGPADLARGDRVEFIAQLAPLRLFRNAPLTDPFPGAARRRAVLSGSALFVERSDPGRGVTAWIDRGRARVRERIFATYSPKMTSLARALVLGENDLDATDQDAFSRSGLMHLLAVSGTHLVIAVLALVRGSTALLTRITWLSSRYDVARFSSGCGAALSILYADFAGGSGSAWRAAFMLCTVCGARALGLHVAGATALGCSLLIGVGLDPLAAHDFSFVLSALATFGLIAWGQPLTRMVADRVHPWPLRALLESFVATLTSTVACAPLVAVMAGELSAAALLGNLVAGPLGEVMALPVCLLHTVSAWFPALESGLALLGSGALYGVRAVALWSAAVEWARFSVPYPGTYDTAGGVLLVAGLAWLRGRETRTWSTSSGFHTAAALRATTARRVAPRALCAATLLWAPCPLLPADADANEPEKQPPSVQISSGAGTPRHAKATLRVTALDVGQGDAIVLDLPDGSLGLVDGGGFATGMPDTGKRVVEPYLRARHVRRIAWMVLSHAHPDHISGLLSVSRLVPVGELWLPSPPQHWTGTERQLVQQVRAWGGTIRHAGQLCGRAHQRFGAQITVLAPCKEADPELSLNDGSLVLRVSFGAHSALLTGDIERRTEADLVATYGASLDAALLKVAHHGSDTSSTPGFLDAVRPRVALVSAGVRNRYDHPRQSTLAALRARGSLILRTDELGSVTWVTDGRSQRVQAFETLRPGLFDWRLLGQTAERHAQHHLDAADP